jgi:hypothetical protein
MIDGLGRLWMFEEVADFLLRLFKVKSNKNQTNSRQTSLKPFRTTNASQVITNRLVTFKTYSRQPVNQSVRQFFHLNKYQ